MDIHQLGSFFFMGLACLAILKHVVVVVDYHFNLFKIHPIIINFLIVLTRLVVHVSLSSFFYHLQYVLYTCLARSGAARFIGTVVLGLIKEIVLPKLYTIGYDVFLAYAFQESSMLLQFVFYGRYGVMADDERERFFVVKLVILHLMTFVYHDLMAGKYLEAATMSIPVTVGLLALVEYKEAWNTLRPWFAGHHDHLNNDLVGGIGNEATAGEIENDLV